MKSFFFLSLFLSFYSFSQTVKTGITTSAGVQLDSSESSGIGQYFLRFDNIGLDNAGGLESLSPLIPTEYEKFDIGIMTVRGKRFFLMRAYKGKSLTKNVDLDSSVGVLTSNEKRDWTEYSRSRSFGYGVSIGNDDGSYINPHVNVGWSKFNTAHDIRNKLFFDLIRTWRTYSFTPNVGVDANLRLRTGESSSVSAYGNVSATLITSHSAKKEGKLIEKGLNPYDASRHGDLFVIDPDQENIYQVFNRGGQRIEGEAGIKYLKVLAGGSAVSLSAGYALDQVDQDILFSKEGDDYRNNEGTLTNSKRIVEGLRMTFGLKF